MKKFLAVLTAVLIAVPSFEVAAWGRKGHETIAKIAERNLTERAKERIEHYLGGHSIVYYAKWMDEYRHTDEYGFTTSWHMTPIDSELRYTDELLDPAKGNAIYGIELATENLRDYASASDSTVNVNLKYLIHLVGDMHCPAHLSFIGRKNDYDVWIYDIYGRPERLSIHLVWDNGVIEVTRVWSVSEWAGELDRCTAEQKAEMSAGTPRDWVHDAARCCEIKLDMSEPDAYLGQDFFNKSLPLIESQILKAGYRLAALLNSLFD